MEGQNGQLGEDTYGKMDRAKVNMNEIKHEEDVGELAMAFSLRLC